MKINSGFSFCCHIFTHVQVMFAFPLTGFSPGNQLWAWFLNVFIDSTSVYCRILCIALLNKILTTFSRRRFRSTKKESTKEELMFLAHQTDRIGFTENLVTITWVCRRNFHLFCVYFVVNSVRRNETTKPLLTSSWPPVIIDVFVCNIQKLLDSKATENQQTKPPIGIVIVVKWGFVTFSQFH